MKYIISNPIRNTALHTLTGRVFFSTTGVKSNTIKKAVNMLGKKDIPPNIGVALRCILRSLGMSYSLLRLQKSRIRGVNTSPQIKLNKKTTSRYIVIRYNQLCIYITIILTLYCVSSHCFFYYLASIMEGRSLSVLHSCLLLSAKLPLS